MVEFRKAFLLMAVLVLVTGVASAQSTCNVTATPTTARSEGYAEPLGDVLMTCAGTAPAGNAINVVLRLGTEVTSRNPGGVLESVIQVGPAGGPPTATYQGVRTGDFEITFNNVIFTGAESMRIVNVRGNATRVGGGALNAILAAVTVSGNLGATLPLITQSGAFLPVAFVSESLLFTAEVVGAPSSANPATFTLSRNQCAFTDVVVNLKWAERTANAFRSIDGEAFPPPGTGTATNATWLRARLTNLPAGATVAVGTNTPTNGAAVPLTAQRIITTGATASNGSAPSFDLPSGSNPLSITVNADGSADIFYAVTNADGVTQETLTVAVTISIPSSVNPPLGDAFGTAAGGYAPFDSTAIPATSKPSAPRFTNSLQTRANPLFSIVTCQTRLLFPFVTSDGVGFETGIAISNTSRDPFSTKAQAGTCALSFYGQGTADGTTQTTSVAVATGKQLLFTLGQGNPAAGINPIGNFTGYMIAVCNFQYAHGYAFISDIGADQLAQGYLALILGAPGSTRGGSTASEQLDQ